MQPVAVFSTRTPGLVFVQGRLAGETAPGQPLILPVSPQGAAYVQFAPYGSRYAPMACRAVFSGGELLPPGEEDGLCAVLWPGRVCEIELSPPLLAPAESEFGTLDGLPVAVLRGRETLLRVAGQTLALPEGASLPEARYSADAGECFLGRVGENAYLAQFAPESFRPLDCVLARRIVREGGCFRALRASGDAVGHGRNDLFRPAADGLELLESEAVWPDGAPRWPKTPEETVLAALEARILGYSEEAESYLAPGLRGKGFLARLTEGADAALALRFGEPSARPAVGLLARESATCARVRAVLYRVSANATAHGMWEIDTLELGRND